MNTSLHKMMCRARVALILIFCIASRAQLDAASEKPNVIFITIDTLRADHLGCYGDRQIQTPSIDALARSAARFTHAYTPVPITLPAHTALFTGSYPMATGMHDFSGNTLPSSAMTLAKVLHDQGYATAAFIGAAVLDSRFGLNQGFDTYFDHFDFTRLDESNLDRMERRGDLVMNEALAWLTGKPRQPFLLWVHLYDPHYPYTPPEPFASRYQTHLYDGEIAFDDAQVGRLMAFLKGAGIYANSLLLLVGDHGEGLGEHGEKTHGFFIYNSTLRVPLLIKVPGTAPRVVEDEASLVDAMPTVLHALRVPVPQSVQGRSLLSVLLGKPTFGTSKLYAENYLPLLHYRWSQLRGFQVRGLKYIDAPRPELYDTRVDPGETKNLFQTQQAIAHEMRGKLLAVLRRYTPAAGGASSAKELTDPALLERLRSLGYVAVSAGTFSDARGGNLPDPKDRILVYELVAEAIEGSQRGRYDESLHKLREAQESEPASLTIQYLLALDYYHLKDFRHAIESFQAALKLQPQFALAEYYLGVSRLETGDLGASGACFHRVLELDPTNFSAAFNLGVVYSRQHRADDAVRAFQLAVKILPEYAEAHEALGEIYLYLGRPDDAVRELERAVAIVPGMQKAHQNLGRAYEAKGLHEKAQQEFERAKTP